MPQARSIPPLLQAPPHPRHRGIARRCAAPAPHKLPHGESIGIADRIVHARIGGRFWSRPDPAARTALDRLGEGAPMIRCDPAALPHLLALCRARHPGRRVAIIGGETVPGADLVHLDDRSDPWPTIDRLGTLYCDDLSAPFVALAALAGRPIVRLDREGEAVPVDTAALAGEVVADLVSGWHYTSPHDGGEWTLGDLLDYLALWRQTAERTAGIGVLLGISRWKRARVRQFLIGSPAARFARTSGEASTEKGDGAIAIWPSRTDEAALVQAAGPARVWRIEDGFIRSAGLGAAFVLPSSLILDRSGIYYDPRSPSDLEQLLQTAEIPEVMRTRARALIAQIRRAGATKYNLKEGLVPLPAGRKIVLVAGQVADDQSVLAAGGGVTMAEMVAVARRENPEAFLIYKPHPDVVAKLRDGEGGEADIAANADLVLAAGDTHALLERADEVHVLSSLLGFEALLRGCRVVAHGQPFYAGWGLTDDRAPVARRTRSRSLDELAAATLILYPLYVDPRSGLPCSPEHLLSAVTGAQPPSAIRMRVARGAAMLGKWTRSGSKTGFKP